MTKILLSILSMLMLSVASYAATVNLANDASTSVGQVASYKWYKSPNPLTAGTAPSANPSAILFATVPSTQLTATSGGLLDGLWYFSATSLGTNGSESVFGNVVSLTVVNPPAPPIGLLATVVSTSQIRLNWTDNSTTEIGFSIERSMDGVSFSTLVTLPSGTITYTDSVLTANTLYYYRVKSTNSGGSSAYTAVVSAITSPTSVSPILVYLTYEAESGVTTAPMQIFNDTNASGGKYIQSTTSNAGTEQFSINIPFPDTYLIWCRVISPNGNSDSVYVTLDGVEDVYGASPFSTHWQWIRVNGGNGTIIPRIFNLTAGTHTLLFRSRELGFKLDKFVITNDKNVKTTSKILNP